VRSVIFTLVAVILSTSQALGFGLLLEGDGYLALDPDNLHAADVFDFDGDGLPDLVQELGNTILVHGLDGSTMWSTTIDTLEICPECTGPGGWWSFYFGGFHAIEPGHYDAVIEYYYDNWDSMIYTRGTLVISTQGTTTRYHFVNRGLDVAVDLDGDEYRELVLSRDNGVNQPSSWEVWGHNGVSSVPSAADEGLILRQNHPNPFNPQTTVEFELGRDGPVRVEIHDAAGRLVYARPLGELPAGRHEFIWRGVDRHGARVASGTYMATVISGQLRQTRKMMLVK